MSVRVFVDTNVLVYTRDASEPKKQQMAESWMKRLWSLHSGFVSFQVLQEYYVTVTEKLKPGLEKKIARSDVSALLAWQPVSIDKQIVAEAWKLQDRYHISFWDSLIVSAAQAAKCRYLLSEDLQQDQHFGEVQVISPFHNMPEKIVH
ncbi:MAG TPA: PIN domain-containing protein [Thermodesulfovibrionales bacterium]|nr:PIN domain-containing protein [Thermodesulfovibrionales bacterium]